MGTRSTLPDHPPSRTVRPGDNPSPKAVRALLAQKGVDATDLDAVACYIRERGWVWRLASGHTYPRCGAAIFAPWVSQDPWAEAWGDSAAEASSIAVALTITTPPPEMVDEGPGEIEV